jgi:biotin carboxyl carrier protein
VSNSNQQVTVIVNGQEFVVEVGDLDSTPIIAVVDGITYEVVLGGKSPGAPSKPRTAVRVSPKPSDAIPKQVQESAQIVNNETSLKAPMPGDIVEVFVKPGQQINVGDSLCVLDAMKMNNVIRSPRAGRIASVEVTIGQSVDHGTVLITFE